MLKMFLQKIEIQKKMCKYCHVVGGESSCHKKSTACDKQELSCKHKIHHHLTHKTSSPTYYYIVDIFLLCGKHQSINVTSGLTLLNDFEVPNGKHRILALRKTNFKKGTHTQPPIYSRKGSPALTMSSAD